MTKARLGLAAGALALLAVPAVTVPALASSTTRQASGPIVSSSGPLLSVCLTVTPKSVTVAINGQAIIGQTAGVPRTCIATPF